MDVNELSSRLFCARRLRGDVISVGQILGDLTEICGTDFGCEQDRLKISMCAPLRRLQQKTQVFPLDVKAASRNRLTHSLEVSQYSRLICFAIVAKCRDYEFFPLQSAMTSCLFNASMMHDIGNPPFGHFGESLIRDWLKKTVENRHISSEISIAEKDDLMTFNGNAQGLRLIHSIQDLNLTLGQYASVIKVPYTVKELLLGKGKGSSGHGIQGDFYSWSYANAGVFLSEKHLLDAIRESFSRDTRHPFATIIECSDDLSYVLADLEDAFDRGLIDRHSIISLCQRVAEYPELEPLCEYFDPVKIGERLRQDKTEALFYLRDVISHFYIDDIARAIANDPDTFIMTGEPNFTGANYPGITILKMLKSFEFSTIYNHFEVQTLDLSGASYVKGLFCAYEKLLFESEGNFCLELSARGGDPFCMRIASRISRRHKETYRKAVATGQFSEMYLRIRLLVDYISGMTDTYAESEYKVLNGIH
ncbi:MAG: dGTP triphosphohydrolase [Succinivibrio sp.]